jgi:hypothetical protein
MRTLSTLDVREWVTREVSDEHLLQALCARAEAIRAAGPAYRGVIQSLAPAAQRFADFAGLPRLTAAELSQGLDDTVLEVVAATAVAIYWEGQPWRLRPLRPGLLPPITSLGMPWSPRQGAVHVLDLGVNDIRLATEKAPPQDTVRRLTEAIERADFERASTSRGVPHQVNGVTVRVARMLAPYPDILKILLLYIVFPMATKAHSAPTEKEAKRWSDAVRSLVNLLLPDVTRHTSRRPDTLATNWDRYRRAYTAAERVHAQLHHDKGSTRAVLQLARTLFNDGRLTHDEVQRWYQRSCRAYPRYALKS